MPGKHHAIIRVINSQLNMCELLHSDFLKGRMETLHDYFIHAQTVAFLALLCDSHFASYASLIFSINRFSSTGFII